MKVTEIRAVFASGESGPERNTRELPGVTDLFPPNGGWYPEVPLCQNTDLNTSHLCPSLNANVITISKVNI